MAAGPTAYRPAVQVRQVVAAVVLEYEPAPHDTHAVVPSSAVPGPHSSHALLPSTGTQPAGHSAHAAPLADVDTLRPVHVRHTVPLAAGATEPAGQAVQVVELEVAAMAPGMQEEQSAAPATGE